MCACVSECEGEGGKLGCNSLLPDQQEEAE